MDQKSKLSKNRFIKINNRFICQECNKSFKTLSGLSSHISRKHFNIEKYFYKWIKKKNEGKCKICGGKTEFKGLYWGYNNCCSQKCSNTFRNKNKIKSLENLYGVDNIYKSKEIIEKIKRTKNIKYKDPNYNNREKSIKTNFKKYGVSHPLKNKDIKIKQQNTNLKKYGHKCSLKNKEVQKKSIETNLKKYGVRYPIQNKKIHLKQQKSALKIKKYKNTEIIYQGSFELDFLDNFYDKFKDLSRGKTIKYYHNKKLRYYYPDFYLPSLNLIIEIKGSYYHKKFMERDIQKKKATIKNGFQYILILDKNYDEFINLISQF
jgi:hypothetical protein